ncbi:LysR family transcriptional regulator [Robbsia sp. KACC 23696]|uniref:LysR family transcriptional regulator n=1 Tax=Robbsia sp. KACC 23696 TaxID=3149231 RepID=UPI00325A60FF
MSLSLEIDLLRSFVVIAETRALTRAADKVGRTQSALSQQMKRLEEIVDQPLFQRTGRGMRLTYPGERLLVHAQRILRAHDEAMADVCGTGLSGAIRFGCPDDYAAVFLPRLLRRFASLHPQVQVEVLCAPTTRLLEHVAVQAVDLALISVTESASDADIIRREPLVWVGYPGVDAAQFDPLPLALSDPDTLDHLAACDVLQRAGRAFRIAYASSSLAGLTAVVRSGQAFAVVTQTAVPSDLAILSGEPAWPALPTIGITVKYARKRPAHLTRVFADHIRATLPLL